VGLKRTCQEQAEIQRPSQAALKLSRVAALKGCLPPYGMISAVLGDNKVYGGIAPVKTFLSKIGGKDLVCGLSTTSRSQRRRPAYFGY